ncbi:MAG: hypothetical protein AUK33_02995 [Flavobacteriaceae bacterium CG2_30_34_30]|nr:hypothetical protein [Flavobacteriia bacterium]OIP51873.1 MAG: hypothetical protein AUK33_02995 [Flavobacteriaceae bacterium CG2_30_34_30]PIQ17663.1 MAG: hypothetical protein COW66_10445 [Flavobacteriaceae bacterium CG18_big_fil_WC_8_21_14_2_50_34_36]PIV51405.1 MAG: hypothetical protein COS19_01370 [Flavobacteriaceae bacterium CG02_land_8_20_14_3_00_34_13]PIZ06978.1 MAG: hypothetical protein COY56_11375 [Flavobacteriaceae bacterium CG_4_10_14_0_8_um_filter_34_31]PJC08551.1 MAG: hypothetical
MLSNHAKQDVHQLSFNMKSQTWNIACLILKGYSLFLSLVYSLPDFALMGGVVKIDFAEKLSSAR